MKVRELAKDLISVYGYFNRISEITLRDSLNDSGPEQKQRIKDTAELFALAGYNAVLGATAIINGLDYLVN